jgi:flagella basal body P-ring formation protein FlgA
MTRKQTTSARVGFQIVVRAALIVLAEACCARFSYADERVLPIPLATIYPGDIIRESMLGEGSFSGRAASDGSLIDSKSALVGKVARRTLLPDRPIPAIAVDAPKVVAVNAQVKIVFDEGGLVITAYGSALQAGAAGDLIRVRNQDSGLVISGRVQPDGSIFVSGG